MVTYACTPPKAKFQPQMSRPKFDSPPKCLQLIVDPNKSISQTDRHSTFKNPFSVRRYVKPALRNSSELAQFDIHNIPATIRWTQRARNLISDKTTDLTG